MFKRFGGFVTGLFAGYVLGLVNPVKLLLIIGLVFVGLVILLFYLFHLGLRDFQGY